MKVLAAISGFVERALAEWREVRLSELVLGERDLAAGDGRAGLAWWRSCCGR